MKHPLAPIPRSRLGSHQSKVYRPNLATPEEKKEAGRLMESLDTMAELRKAWLKK